MDVLSLFDGISCGMVAAKRAGLKIDNYYAYEIDQNAIKISKKNYPNIVHCGDVIIGDFAKYKGIDLIKSILDANQCISIVKIFLLKVDQDFTGQIFH